MIFSGGTTQGPVAIVELRWTYLYSGYNYGLDTYILNSELNNPPKTAGNKDIKVTMELNN